eukprot:m.237769 g.237769  ORF g.237769 m.237769 type:complete len:130 (-) comp16057_c0_seq47:1825-2214(-)
MYIHISDTVLCEQGIGFRSEDSMHRVFVASSILVLLLTSVRVMDMFGFLKTGATFTEIFESPFAIYGNIAMFLALLIMSSVYETSSSKFMYWKLNILFFFLLLALQFAGSVLSMMCLTDQLILWSYIAF